MRKALLGLIVLAVVAGAAFSAFAQPTLADLQTNCNYQGAQIVRRVSEDGTFYSIGWNTNTIYLGALVNFGDGSDPVFLKANEETTHNYDKLGDYVVVAYLLFPPGIATQCIQKAVSPEIRGDWITQGISAGKRLGAIAIAGIIAVSAVLAYFGYRIVAG